MTEFLYSAADKRIPGNDSRRQTLVLLFLFFLTNLQVLTNRAYPESANFTQQHYEMLNI